MASGNETVAEIVKEIRTIPWKVYNQEIESNDDCGISQSYCNVLAARIEAAHKREVSELKNKCEEYERQSELTAETAKVALELLKTQESKIKELRECLRIIRDNLLFHTIKSEDGKYVNNGAFLSEEFIDDERWRKALERTDNENKDE